MVIERGERAPENCRLWKFFILSKGQVVECYDTKNKVAYQDTYLYLWPLETW